MLPAHRRCLSHLDQLQEEDLNPEFREQVADFCFYILSHSKAKTLSGGITVNGPRESLLLSFLTWTFLQPIIDNRSGRHEDYFWQMQSLMMPRKTHHKGHIVNFTSEPKLFLVLSNIHRSRMNKEKELESNPGVVTFSTNFSTPFLWNSFQERWIIDKVRKRQIFHVCEALLLTLTQFSC